ncbi:autotransporter domain-containing protein [Acetobacter orientalis]|uniref:autotransporter outer membrane beta-barrel domain-containing protein n=1 Tax=Acetobacter orientalis TaxID=146474 RepID=UPI0039EA66DC
MRRHQLCSALFKKRLLGLSALVCAVPLESGLLAQKGYAQVQDYTVGAGQTLTVTNFSIKNLYNNGFTNISGNSSIVGQTNNTGTLASTYINFWSNIINSGSAMITGGNIQGNVVNQNGGTFAQTKGAIVGDVTNSSAALVSQGTITGTVNNAQNGTFTAVNETLNGNLNNSGVATLSYASVTGVVTNSNTLTADNASMEKDVVNSGAALINNNSTIGGNLTMQDGSSTSVSASIAGTMQANGGTFEVLQGGTQAASLSGTADGTLSGQLTLNNAQDTYSGRLAGSGSLLIAGGNEVLTGESVYTGSTTIEGASLTLGNGGETGSIANTSTIVNNGTLNINHSNTVTLSQSMSGSGVLNQVGPGTTVITSDNSYTGATTVAAGTLDVVGSIAPSAVTVQSGAKLSGTGAVGTTDIQQNATLSPTGPTGVLTVNGNLTLGQGSAITVEGNGQKTGQTLNMDGITYSQIQSGKVNVTGTAAVSGTVSPSMTPADALRAHQYYTVVTAAGGFTDRSYTLTGNINNPYTFLSPRLFYYYNDLNVMMLRNSVLFSSVATTRNEIENARALDKLPERNEMIQAVEQLDPAQARHAMNALSGEVHASARTALIQDSFFVRQAVLDRLDTAECDGSVSDNTIRTVGLKGGKTKDGCTAHRSAFWGEGYGSFGHNRTDSNAAGMHSTTTGVVLGLDTLVTDNWRLGLMAGYGRSMFDVGGGRNSSGNSNNISVGAYSGHHWGRFNFRFGGSYSWNLMSITRDVNFVGYHDRLHSSYNGGTAQGFGEVGYKVPVGQRGVFEPFGNVAYVNLKTKKFNEYGGMSALHGHGTDTGVTFATFGFRAATWYQAGQTRLVPHFSLAYRHAFGLTTPTLHETFIGTNSGVMDIAGVPLSQDSAVVNAGLTAKLTDRIDIGVSYIGQYGVQSLNSGARGNLVLKF